MQFRKKQIKTLLLSKKNSVSIFFLILAISQFLSYEMANRVSSSVNGNQFFGLIGNNALAIIASVVIIAIVLLCCSKQYNLLSSIIISGSISNILDRLIYGGVVDYINLPFFPIFNLADIFIVFGIIALCYSLLMIKKPAI